MRHTRTLAAVAVALLALAATASDAQARHRVYHPTVGRFMQRDPVGTPNESPLTRNLSAPQFTRRDPVAQYRDGMSLYQYVRSSPSGYVDPMGLSSEDGGCVCGPRVDEALFNAALVIAVRMQGVADQDKGEVDGLGFMHRNGIKMDLVPKRTTEGCPVGKPCEGTVTLAGKCILQGQLNRILYAMVSQMVGTGWATEAGGQYYNLPRYGVPEGPFEHGAYALGRSIAGFLADPTKPLTADAMNSAIKGAELKVELPPNPWVTGDSPEVEYLILNALDVAADGDKLKQCTPCEIDAEKIDPDFSTTFWSGKSRVYNPLTP